MAKQPFLPLCIDDWERDTNCLTPFAEFALFKLNLKLYFAKNKGFYKIPFENIAVLLKSDFDKTKAILIELAKSKLLVINEVGGSMVEIINPQFNKEYRISMRPAYKQSRINACVFTSKSNIRKRVFELYGKQCLCCGSTKKIALDHVVSIKNGGENSIDNLQPLCMSCNSSKGYRTIDYRTK